ncbi:GtrA family protein [Arthrobacter sp.]|uniref:GtrA family protein n=1 Tax=Arthrobacter sp. TaxID=1667 RepID=UPI0025890F6F|nr:GtrA family protein [Arthrobacter sp.]
MPATANGGTVRAALSRFWQRHPLLYSQLRGFGVVAVICTAVSMLIFAALRHPMGTQWANAISLVLCSVLNTELNRRISFGVHGMHLWWRDQRRGLWVMLLALAMTSGSLWLLHELSPKASIVSELVVITLGNVASAVMRFVLLRYWIFRRLRRPVPAPA